MEHRQNIELLRHEIPKFVPAVPIHPFDIKFGMMSEEEKKKWKACMRLYEFTTVVGLTKAVINKKYKLFSVTHHPDKGGDAEKFKEYTESKDVLLNFVGDVDSE